MQHTRVIYRKKLLFGLLCCQFEIPARSWNFTIFVYWMGLLANCLHVRHEIDIVFYMRVAHLDAWNVFIWLCVYWCFMVRGLHLDRSYGLGFTNFWLKSGHYFIWYYVLGFVHYRKLLFILYCYNRSQGCF